MIETTVGWINMKTSLLLQKALFTLVWVTNAVKNVQVNFLDVLEQSDYQFEPKVRKEAEGLEHFKNQKV